MAVCAAPAQLPGQLLVGHVVQVGGWAHAPPALRPSPSGEDHDFLRAQEEELLEQEAELDRMLEAERAHASAMDAKRSAPFIHGP